MSRTFYVGVGGRLYRDGKEVKLTKPKPPAFQPGDRCIWHGLRGDMEVEVVKVLTPYSIRGVTFSPVRVRILRDDYERNVDGRALTKKVR